MKTQSLIILLSIFFITCEKEPAGPAVNENSHSINSDCCAGPSSEISTINLLVKDSTGTPIDSCIIWTECHSDQCLEYKYANTDGLVSFDVIYQFEFGNTPDQQEIHLEKDSLVQKFNVFLNKGSSTNYTHFIN